MRTGTFYYINQVNIDPDIVLLGKSLAGGYYPLSAVIGRKELFESIPLEGSGFDSTFANNPLGLRIANKVIDFIEEKRISKRVGKTGKEFLDKLRKLEKFRFIKDINGIGMAFSYRVESLANALSTNAKLAKEIKKVAFKNHLIIQTAGVNGDYMKLSPSFFISDEEIDVSVRRLNKVMEIVSKIGF
jgi:4-aminobutyrate aminotransferase/(S)-3-amino-2-methylpropionate transaminase